MPSLDANSESTLRVAVTEHLTKHRVKWSENNHSGTPALWGDITINGFYFEASYPTEAAYVADAQQWGAEQVILIGFPADPVVDDQRIGDPTRLDTLKKLFDKLRTSTNFVVEIPKVLNDAGVIPIKYAEKGNVPRTKAIGTTITKSPPGTIAGHLLEYVLDLVRQNSGVLAGSP